MNSPFRHFRLIALAAGAVSVAALTWVTSACISSGSNGGIGQACESNGDCTTPSTCLHVSAAGACTEEDGGAKTCQQGCSSNANCESLTGSTTYTCSPNLSKCTAPNAEICLPGSN
jgi:hypothetical protein